MKKILLLISVLVIGNTLFAQNSVCKTTTPLTIDGNDSDWSNLDSTFQVNNLISGAVGSPSDLSGQFKVTWDNTYLYIFGTVQDDSFVNDSTIPWDDDSFEVYIDGGNEKTTTYDANDHQLMIRYNDLKVHDISGGQINPLGVDFKMIPSNQSYQIEVRISWSFIGIPAPTQGTSIGLDIHLNDDDAVQPGDQGVLIPASDWAVYFDPNNPNSYNHNRTDCQLIVAGNRFNTGDLTDGLQAGTGYGLSFDSNSEIHSFPINGETLRFGAKTVNGLCGSSKAFIQRHVWMNDGSYDEAQQQNAINLSTIFPGIDRTFYDGTRAQMACLPTSIADQKAVKVGPGADVVRVAATWRIESWMLALDGNAALHNLHEPGVGVPSPLSTYLGNGGKLTIITRDASAPVAQGTHVPTTTRADITITAADVGDWWSIVYDYQLDPTGSGYMNVWLDKGTGFQQIVQVSGGLGYMFALGDINNEKFYPVVLNFYSWHRYTVPGVVNNWDNTYGDTRELAYAFTGFQVNGTTTPQELMSHTHYYTCGTTSWPQGGGARDASLAWSDINNEAWSNPSVFGTITLGNCTPSLTFDLKVLLEGAYDYPSGIMSNALHQLELLPGMTFSNPSQIGIETPAGQPYSIAPWNYPGTEGQFFSNNDYAPTSVDWVLMSLRTGIDANTEIHQAAGIVKQDGTIQFLAGSEYNGSDPGPYFVLIEHRNHMGALTAQALTPQNSVLTYDFTTQNSWVPNNGGFGQKEISFGRWGLYAADGDQLTDTVGYDINVADRIYWDSENGIFTKYQASDYNLDGEVTGADRILWNVNTGVNSSVPK